MRNKLKFGDFIIIGVVLVMAGALAAALTFHSSGDKLYAEVWQNDTLIERVQLTDATDRTIKLDGNTIVLSGKTAKMADADCRDQVCVRTGTLTHAGQAAVCLPHRVQEKKWDSPYKDWFHISFDGNSNYNDGFWYEGWEGHFELVKLNLRHPDVQHHIFECIRQWKDEFGIDGLRLDVAYCLDKDFIRALRGFCDSLSPDFFLVGELLHGDYNQFVGDGMLHSCTNYECYKGLYSSMNSCNLFEITHSLLRQFGPENWTLYKGKHLLSFVDNHDVTRVASILQNPAHLPLIYALLFGMPGIPCIYYGSEWGAEGKKQDGDDALRPSFEQPIENDLTARITAMAKAHRESRALCYGGFKQLVLTNKQCIWERETDGERVLVAVNIDEQPYHAHFDARCGRAVDLITGEMHDFGGGSELPPYSAYFWKCER